MISKGLEKEGLSSQTRGKKRKRRRSSSEDGSAFKALQQDQPVADNILQLAKAYCEFRSLFGVDAATNDQVAAVADTLQGLLPLGASRTRKHTQDPHRSTSVTRACENSHQREDTHCQLAGNTYQSINISGSAKAHLGNNYYNLDLQQHSCTGFARDRPPDLPEPVAIFLDALNNGLRASVLAFLRFWPLLRSCLRTLTAICRAPGLSPENNIYFEDALGRSLTLDYGQFRHWPVMLVWLQCNFKGCPGEQRVMREHFQIVDLKTDQGSDYTDPVSAWERFSRPGSRLAMSMMCSLKSAACPKGCGFEGACDDRRWQKCGNCNLVYSVQEKPHVSVEASASNSDGAVYEDKAKDGTSSSTSSLGHPARDAGWDNNDDEIEFFKRVHGTILRVPPLGSRLLPAANMWASYWKTMIDDPEADLTFSEDETESSSDEDASSESSIGYEDRRAKTRCWAHGCRGREFDSLEDFERHQEETYYSSLFWCSECGTAFTSSVARDSHVAHGSCTGHEVGDGKNKISFSIKSTAAQATSARLNPMAQNQTLRRYSLLNSASSREQCEAT